VTYYPAVTCQPHTLYHPTYPRRYNDCNACHTSTFAQVPNGAKSVATTLDAGASPWTTQNRSNFLKAVSMSMSSCLLAWRLGAVANAGAVEPAFASAP
jgi:hypothetical protein